MATKYVVLLAEDDEEFVVLAQRYEATNPEAAMKAAAADTMKAGTYGAAPARSWQTLTIAIDANPRVTVVKGQG